MSDSLNQGVLVTIVCETVLQERLIQLLIKLGVVSQKNSLWQ